MSEISISRTENKEVIIHKFYCDDCGKYLGESEENNDGWYFDDIGKIREHFYINTCESWFTLNKNLCDNCIPKMENKVFNALLDLGFVKEFHN